MLENSIETKSEGKDSQLEKEHTRGVIYIY